MSGRWLPVVLVAAGSAALAGRAQGPAETPANKENIEAALRLTQAAAAEYEMRAGADEKEKPLELRREPVLRWSNPDRGEVHGNVFLWTRDGRPFVVGSLYKWFSPFTHMAHEFHSLTPDPLSASFHGKPVWKTAEPGLRFANVPGAPAPAAAEAQRLLQLRQLAREFTGWKKERDGLEGDLRLLPQPVHRYSAPKQGVLTGGLFAFVQGTDPEIFLLVEARGESAAKARWQFAVTRMTSAELRLRHGDRQVWSAETLPWKAVSSHELPYTSFGFNVLPEFLKDAMSRPKP
jgi:hypothetical protein